jgi:hypothetical protein
MAATLLEDSVVLKEAKNLGSDCKWNMKQL